MEGITPTLAFAALFFGLSGHPQDKAQPIQQAARHEQLQTVDYRVWTKVPCANFANAAGGPDSWVNVLEHGTALASATLGEPTEPAAAGDPFADEIRMLFEEPILAYDDGDAESGCGAAAP